MKKPVQITLLVLGWLGVVPLAASAQCPTGMTTTLDFGAAARNGEDWDVTAAPDLANPLASNIGGTPTDVTPGFFTTASSNPASYLQVRRYGTLLTLGDESRQLEYATLEWFADYTSSAAKSSSVTFAFSRPLANYSITLQDIDRASGSTPGFIDMVQLNGYDVNGNLVALPASSFTYNPTYQSVAGNTVTGLSDISNTSSSTGLVTVSFPVPLTKLVVTYSNGTSKANPDQQAIGISQMSWCKVMPVANNDSRDVPLNTAVNGNVVLNDSDDEQNTLTASLLTSPTHGTLMLSSNGSYRYTPAMGYTGPDNFTYKVCTANGCASAAVNLRVYSTTTACTSASGTNLLANADFNAGNTGFTTTYKYVAGTYVNNDASSGVYPEGTYTVASNPTAYHPSFQATGHTAGVTNDKFMIVNGASSIRTFYSQTVAVQPNRYYTFSAFFNNLLPPPAPANDGVPEMGFVINGESVSGTIRAERLPDAWVSFSDVWYSGSNTTATFEIRNVSTATGGNDLAVDDVYFGSCNLAPTAVADAASTTRGTAVAVSVLANDLDTDSNNQFNFASIDVDPTQSGVQSTRVLAGQGTFAVNTSTGVVTFTPEAGFVGTAVTTYVVQDNDGAPTNAASLVVAVQQATADLAVRLTAPANNVTVTAGQPLTFTVQVTNNGPAAAGSVVPTVQLPAGLTGAGAGGALVFSNGGFYNAATGLVSLPATSSLANGATAAYSVTFYAPGTGSFVGTATAASATPDASSTDNTATASVNVTASFDLTTSLSSPATAGAGTPLTFSVVTRNAGPAPATGAVQTVSLPGNRTQLFVSGGGTYAYNAATDATVVTFPAQDLPAGQSRHNTISFTAAAPGTLTATAAVEAASGESNATNNGATAATSLSATTGLPANVYATVAVTSGGAAVVNAAAGTPLALALTVGNAGPGPAATVQPRLALPAGLDPATLTLSGGGTYVPATGVVSWPALPALASGSTSTFTVQMAAPGFGPVLLHGSAATATADPVPADNGAAQLLTINPAPDVATTVAGPATALAGQRLTYTVTTTNLGLAAAANVQQFVRVPPAAANLSYTNNLLATSTGSLDVQPDQALLTYPLITTLAPGQSVTNTVTFDAPAAGSFPVTGFAITTSPDRTPANNSSTISVASTTASDVVARVSGPATVVNGTPVVYSVEVRNNGTSPAGSVAATAHLPVGLSSVVVRDAAGAVIGGAYNATTGLVTLPTLTNVPVGANGATTRTITFNAPDVAAINVTAVADVPTTDNDLNRTNNAATTSTSVVRLATGIVDMATTIRANVASQTAGLPVIFTVTTTNNSAVEATSVVQRVNLPLGLSAASLTISNGGSYDAATGIVSWEVATLGAGSPNALTNTIQVVAPGTGTLTAVASVGSDNSDAAPAGNTDVASASITPQLNLRSIVRGPSAQASALTGTAVAGQPVTYLLRVTNDGPSPAQNVTYTAQIPAGLDPATVVVSGGGSYAASGTVTFPAIGTLQAGAAASAAYTVTFPAPASMASYTVAGTLTTSSAQTGISDDSQLYTTNLLNLPPVAHDIVNQLSTPIGSTATGKVRISPLNGRDLDGSVVAYTITQLPPATDGTLYFSADGSTFAAVTAGQTVPATDADKFYFQPFNSASARSSAVTDFVGNTFFRYTATDNNTVPATSPAAVYVLQVGQDNAAEYTAAPVKGGATPYQDGDELTSAFDANGGEYSGTTPATIVDNGIRAAVLAPGSTLPPGTILNAATGTIAVANRLLLTPGTYSATVQTTDELGGVTSQPVTFTIGARPLPVTLVSFTATAKGSDALVTWATASEQHNAGFEVERSADGRVFEKAGAVAGRGNSTTRQQYSFTDARAALLGGTLYYRLKQTDLDGTTNYTPVQVVTFGPGTPAPAEAGLTLYPNPATDVLHLRLAAAAQQGQVAVYSLTGQLLLRQPLGSPTGTTLRIGQLPQGTYLLQVTDANGLRQTGRFVKN